MKIRSKQFTGVAFCFLLIISTGIALISTAINIRTLSQKNFIAHDVTLSVFKLSMLANEYVFSPADYTLTKWDTNYNKIIETLKNLKADNAEEQIGIDKIHNGCNNINLIFIRNFKNKIQDRLLKKTELHKSFLYMVFIQSQLMVNNAFEIQKIRRQKMMSAQNKAMVLSILFMITLAACMTFFTSLFNKDILKPLKNLHNGIRKISNGDLDHEIRIFQNDEIGELSRSFNEMTLQLKNSLISLKKEISERKAAESSLRKAKDEIEGWNKELEKRVLKIREELVRSQARMIQSEKLSAMGQMAGGLAHELNSPLAGLLPMIELYRNDAKEGSRAYQELNHMLNACKHMAKVVGDFSNFSREIKEDFYPLNINNVIDDTLSFSISRFKQKHIQIVKKYYNELPDISGEKTGLQQVFLNIITNALDAMPDEGIFTIKTGIAANNKNILIEFNDNGSGIKEDNIKKIFDPFHTTKRPGKGTGLGLSVSFNIIKKHKGTISAKSEMEQGTTFSITLPVFGHDS